MGWSSRLTKVGQLSLWPTTSQAYLIRGFILKLFESLQFPRFVEWVVINVLSLTRAIKRSFSTFFLSSEMETAEQKAVFTPALAQDTKYSNLNISSPGIIMVSNPRIFVSINLYSPNNSKIDVRLVSVRNESNMVVPTCEACCVTPKNLFLFIQALQLVEVEIDSGTLRKDNRDKNKRIFLVYHDNYSLCRIPPRFFTKSISSSAGGSFIEEKKFW